MMPPLGTTPPVLVMPPELTTPPVSPPEAVPPEPPGPLVVPPTTVPPPPEFPQPAIAMLRIPATNILVDRCSFLIGALLCTDRYVVPE
jgi:hypothetical protein